MMSPCLFYHLLTSDNKTFQRNQTPITAVHFKKKLNHIMKKGKIYIGTSGWHYKHWKNIFYPKDLKESEQLPYFAKIISTVEINNSFYRLPEISTFKSWYKEVPADFVFAVKGSRFITHMKKLKVDQQTIDDFMQRAGHLRDKLGPILFQLPPRWKVNTERFSDFLALLPAGHRFAFEFRDHSWNISAIHRLLEQYGSAYCIYELAGYQSPTIVTAEFVYIRLHGPGNKYEGSYDEPSLTTWAQRCCTWSEHGKDVYLYFDNDQNAYATQNALTLIELLR